MKTTTSRRSSCTMHKSTPSIIMLITFFGESWGLVVFCIWTRATGWNKWYCGIQIEKARTSFKGRHQISPNVSTLQSSFNSMKMRGSLPQCLKGSKTVFQIASSKVYDEEIPKIWSKGLSPTIIVYLRFTHHLFSRQRERNFPSKRILRQALVKEER